MDERGYCRIAGRLKDMIIRGGENIYPREIEQVLFGHPAVADVAVVGVPDAWGEVVVAVSPPAPPPADLSELCRGRLAGYKIPARWAFTSTFPLTATGKIRKDVLSAQLADAPGPAGLAAVGGDRIRGGRTTARSVN